MCGKKLLSCVSRGNRKLVENLIGLFLFSDF
jgi:hypothetical protein